LYKSIKNVEPKPFPM